MRFGARSFFAFAVSLAASLAASSAHADPQLSGAVTTGLALTDLRASNAPRLAYHLGGRFDALFLRDRAEQMALGPYVDVATEAFDTFEAGGGLEWLVPAGGPAFVFSAGAFARTSRFGVEPGMAGTIFWGSKSYNYSSLYGIGAGLFLQGRCGFGDGKQTDAILGVQIDLEYLALGPLLVWEAFTH